MREVVDLGDDLVEPIDFLDDDLVEILAEIGVIETAPAGVARKS